MKRKLTAMLLTVSMLLTLFPFAAFAAPVEAAPAAGNEAAVVTADGETEYATLQAAINAASAGDTVKLLRDVQPTTPCTDTRYVVNIDKGITLDGQNHIIDCSKSPRGIQIVGATEKSGEFTVTVKNLTATNTQAYGHCIGTRGGYMKLVLDGVKVDTTGATGNPQALTIGDCPTDNVNITMKNCNIQAGKGGYGVIAFKPMTLTVDQASQITGYGAIYLKPGAANSTVTLKGGSVVCGDNQNTGASDDFGTIVMEGGCNNIIVQDATVKASSASATQSVVYNSQNPATSAPATSNNVSFAESSKVEMTGDKSALAIGTTGANKNNVVVNGGTFNKDVTEFLAADKGQNPDGTVGALTADNAAAKIGDQLYSSLSAAIAAAKDGEVIEVLKNVTVPSAQYVITKNITLKSTNNAKIDVTVAPGVATKAFSVQAGAGLTLDGVTMTINGTKNANGTNDGTGMDIYNSTKAEVKGASLTLKNGAVLTLTNLERATIASSTPHNVKVVNQSTVSLEPGTTMNITNIDGNGANGGNWTVDGAALNVDGCGSYGVSAQTVTAKNNATVAVKNVGISGVTAKDVAIEKGSQVNVTQSGTKLPYTDWKGNKVNDVVALKDQGSLTLDKDSALTLTDNVGADGNPVNTFGPGNGTVDMAGQFVGEVNAPAPDAQKNEVRITYTVNGDVYKSFVATKSAETVTFTEPAAPSVAGYTFNGWNYGDVKVAVAEGNVTFTPAADKAEYTFTANLSAIVAPKPNHQVTVPTVQNGTVAVTPQNAAEGATVTITATPDKGFVVDTVVVKDATGKAVTVTKNADGTYSFKMPASKVDVAVTFKAEQAAPTVLPFVDVAENDWFYPAVGFVYEQGMMAGMSDTVFAPNVTLSRAMMAQVLYNMEGTPQAGKGQFTDVKDGDWYANAVNWAAKEGIVAGMGDGTFAPNDNLTREQMAAILYRFAKYSGFDMSAKGDLAGFADANKVSPWAQESMSWAVGAKIVSGMGDNTLAPQGTATRAQVAMVLLNFCANMNK